MRIVNSMISIGSEFTEVHGGNGQSTSKTGTKTGTRAKTGTKLGTEKATDSNRKLVVLTDQSMKALGKHAVTEGRDIKTKDVTTKGLLLFSRSNGTQSWLYRFTIDGHDKSVTLGQFPEMTLAQARQAADSSRSSVKRHGDVNGTEDGRPALLSIRDPVV